MSELEEIPIRIMMRGDAFVSARNMVNIIYFANQAAADVELQELDIIRRELKDLYDIPDYIYDSVELNLQKKSGSTLLIQKANTGSVILEGVAIGLTIWLLNITIGTTIREAWKESDMHKRLKEILLKQLGEKKQVIGGNIQKRLEHEGIDTGLEVTDKSIDVYVSQTEDKEISADLRKKNRNDQRPSP